MGALGDAVTGLRLFFEDHEKRRALMAEIAAEAGVTEGTPWTPEQKTAMTNLLAERIMKGERLYERTGDGAGSNRGLSHEGTGQNREGSQG